MELECFLFSWGLCRPERRRASVGWWLHLGAEDSLYLRDSILLPPLPVGALGWDDNRQAILSQELPKERLTAVPSLGLAIVLASCEASLLARHFVSAGMWGKLWNSINSTANPHTSFQGWPNTKEAAIPALKKKKKKRGFLTSPPLPFYQLFIRYSLSLSCSIPDRKQSWSMEMWLCIEIFLHT